MIDEKLIEKFYSKLFTIPRKRITVSIGLVTIALASLLNGTVSKAFFAQRYFFIGLGLIVCIFIAAFSLKMALNSRRIFFLSLFILIFVELFDFIAIHIVKNFNLIIMAPATMAAGLTLILFFTSESSEIRTAIISALILIAIYPVDFAFSFEAPHRFLAYILTILIGIFFAFIFIKYIDRNYDGINLKRLLRSFLLFWLTSKPEYFERELIKTSCRKKGWVKCLEIGKAKLITTSFHPGPLRNVGGARMVDEILNRVENSIYLHSPAKHDSNPSTSKDVEEVLKAIEMTDSTDPVKPLKPLEIEGENFSLKILPFNRLKLIFISGKEAIEDIPENINEFARSIFGECVVIDCHNCHRENYEISDDDLREIRELLKIAHKKLDCTKTDLKHSFHRKKVETANVCGYVAMLLLDFGGELYTLLMLDGNNVDCGFKKELEVFFAERGINAIVLSTDNHAKTAVSPKVGYMPVGSDKAERKIILDFIREVLSGLEKPDENELERVENIGYGVREVEINVMGNEFFKSVERTFKEIGEKAMYLFFAVIAMQLAASLILGNAIM